jgi:hypothetical protein
MDNNRLTLMQHHDLKRLLEKIRYLKNWSREIDTEKPNENLAHKLNKEIIEKVAINGINGLWDGVAYEDSNPRPTIEQKISQIKSGQDKRGEDIYKYLNLNYFYGHFCEL